VTARRIASVVRKLDLRDQGSSDFAYRQSQPPSARLAALEEIRREHHRWKSGAEPRLQRVYSIVKQ
jgi:hypothetical protein